MYALNTEIEPVTETAPLNTVHLMVRKFKMLYVFVWKEQKRKHLYLSILMSGKTARTGINCFKTTFTDKKDNRRFDVISSFP